MTVVGQWENKCQKQESLKILEQDAKRHPERYSLEAISGKRRVEPDGKTFLGKLNQMKDGVTESAQRSWSAAAAKAPSIVASAVKNLRMIRKPGVI